MSAELQIYIYDLHDAKNAQIVTNISLNVIIVVIIVTVNWRFFYQKKIKILHFIKNSCFFKR